MSSKRAYLLMIGLLVLSVLGVLGGVYGVNSILSSQSGKLADTKAHLAALNQEQLELTQAKKDIATYRDLYNISQVVVPQSKNQAQAVRQIADLAAKNSINLQSITFPESSLGSTSSNTSTTGTATVKPSTAGASATSGANPSLSQLKPVPQIPGVYDLELVVASSTDSNHLATYPELINFLSALEQNRLTALVSKIAIAPDSTASVTKSTTAPSLFSFVLTLDIYINPGVKK